MSGFKFIRHYFGMSGCFKSTTIEATLESKLDYNSKVAMWSDIKTWKQYEYKFGLEKSDLNYAALHLCRLKNYIYDITFPDQIRSILVERGVSDMLFYYYEKAGKLGKCNGKYVEKFVKEEEILEEQYSYYNPEKILLVQKDINFIKEVILKEPTRAECFPGGVNDYLEQQDKYIEFTNKYNKITDTIIIEDAEKYIKNLGLVYNPSK